MLEYLAAAGASPQQIAETALHRGIVVYGLAAEEQSLEDVFFDLTNAEEAIA